MAKFTFRITYDQTTVLSDVQNFSFTRGRREIQDPFKAGQATITGRNLATLPTIEIGKTILIEDVFPAFSRPVFFGQVADVQITYGYVANEDVWTIQVEDFLAVLGRAYTSNNFSWAAGINTEEAARLLGQNALPNFPFFFTGFGAFTASSLVSAQSLPNRNALDIANTLAATEQAFMFSSSSPNPPGIPGRRATVNFIPRSALGSYGVLAEFTDGTDGGAAFIKSTYSEVVFRSQADSFFNRVVVEPQGLAAQESGTGDRSFVMRSFDQTTTQAKNLADYVKATFDVQTQVPSTISALSESQTNTGLTSLMELFNSFAEVDLYLRGVKYRLFVIGLTVTATPDQTRFTFNVASSEALNFFVLDSAEFGVLDQNKLGF
jgi:hypothetical protein